MTALWVMLGGAVGSLCRYGIGVGMARAFGGAFPAGTFIANSVGALLIGFVMSFAATRGMSNSPLRIALTIGLLGGFTTFSALSYEVVALIQEGRGGTAMTYLGLTLVTGLGAAYLGLWAGARL